METRLLIDRFPIIQMWRWSIMILAVVLLQHDPPQFVGGTVVVDVVSPKNHTNVDDEKDPSTCASSTYSSSNYSSSSNNESCRVDSILDHVPTIALHNGIQMPLLQLGTAQLITKTGIDSTVPERFVGMVPERAFRQIELALQNGIRAFDTAFIYRSHVPIGHVLGEWWRTGQLRHRNEVWIQTKLFHPNATQMTFGITHMPHLDQMTPDEISKLTLEHAEMSLMQLNVGYVDLLLLHWPSGVRNQNDNTATMTNETPVDIDWSLNNEYNNRQRRFAAWKVLEDLYQKGWARAIGVSNFSVKHMEQLQEDGATILPMVNQIEASVTLQYTDIARYCIQNNIVPQAYSPFGRQLTDVPLDILQEMVERHHKKDYGQIIIKYLLQIGYSVVFLSNTPERMVSNMNVFDFYLSLTDILTLKELSRPDGGWGLPSPDDLL